MGLRRWGGRSAVAPVNGMSFAYSGYSVPAAAPAPSTAPIGSPAFGSSW